MAEWRADRIDVRPLRVADLPLLHQWLNAAHVRPGWFAAGTYPAGGYSYDAIVRDYGGSAAGHGRVAAFVVAYGAVPIGYLQCWRVGDFLDYAGHFVDDPRQAATTASLDFLIGEVDYVGGGLGPLVLGGFLREVVFGASDIDGVVINPDPANVPAIRAYEKVGFRHAKTVRPSGQRKPSYLMRIARGACLER